MQRRLYSLGLAVLVLGFLALAAHAVFVPGAAARGYGIDAGSTGWIAATGLRDAALAVAIAGVWWQRPSAMRPVLAGALIVPLGDIGVVASSGAPALALTPHVVGAVGIAALYFLAPKPEGTEPDRSA